MSGGGATFITGVENIEPIRFCHWAAPEWSDIGATGEATWYKVALIAVATANTVAQIAIAKKRYDIAKAYADIAMDQWNRFRDAYLPLEQAMLNEVGSEPLYDPQYAQVRVRYTEYARQPFAEAQGRLGTLARRLALCVDASLLRDLDLSEGIATDDGVNFAFRNEEYYKWLRDDLRWNRRSNLLNVGRDNLARSATYAQSANKILSDLGNLANQGAQGAMTALGYLNNRRDTHYPTQFAGTTALVGDAGYGGLFGGLYSGAQLGPSANTI